MNASCQILLLLLAANICLGQTNAPTLPRMAHSLMTNISDSALNRLEAALPRKPIAVITLTNDMTQSSILAITDQINASHGMDGFIDGSCGFGALLSREYLGSNSMATVSFAWDHSPKRTTLSLYTTNTTLKAAWNQDMKKALRAKFANTLEVGPNK